MMRLSAAGLRRQLDFECSGHLFIFISVINNAVRSFVFYIIFSHQITFASIPCSSNRDNNVYWCNRTDEYCCIDGCCILIQPSDINGLAVYTLWYFWVGLGLLFLFLIAIAVICAIKCYRHTQNNLQWSTNDINNEELYRTMQDARGLIRPFLASKEPATGSYSGHGSGVNHAGVATLHSYGLAGTNLGIEGLEDGISPLQPPYPPLRPPGAASLAARRNSDQIASIIMPPGFVQSSATSHDHT